MMKSHEKYNKRYKFHRPLGAGTGGTVFLAYDKQVGREVAIKVTPIGNASTEKVRHEVDILKKLRHQSLPQLHDFWIENQSVYMVMSYISGHSLESILKGGKPPSKRQLLDIGIQLTEVVHYLHTQSPPVIHGDIKPGNIMLTKEGKICLVDFNISFLLDNDVIGYTVGYTSPEQQQYADEKRRTGIRPAGVYVTPLSDIYSIGATLYHLATGFKRMSYNEFIHEKEIGKHYGDVFTKIIKRAMEADSRKRYSNAYDLLNALKGATEKEILQRQHKRSRMIKKMVVFVSFFAIIGALGLGMNLYQSRQVNRYNQLVASQRSYREAGDFERNQELFFEAREIFPEGTESFYQKALGYFEQERYEDAIGFIEHELEVNRQLQNDSERLVSIYELLAQSYFRINEYRSAVTTYERLFEISEKDNMVIVRDYAIALINHGELERAHSVLDRAISDGMGEDFVYYIRGEMAFVEESYESAIADFTRAATLTEDTSMLVRAYLMLSRIHEKTGNREKERLVLLEAVDEIPIGQRNPLLQRLAQANIDLGKATGNHDYFIDAIEVSQLIAEQYRASFTTYNNIVVLSKEIGDFVTADTTLSMMAEQFGNNYIIYMRRAFMEIDMQELKNMDQRDYTEFLHYYQIATALYEEQLRGNDTDFEMAELEIAYWQLQAGGWFD